MKLIALCIFILLRSCLQAQVSNSLPWTWMSGTNAMNSNGVYGTMNIPSSANYPGAREGGGINWTDASGNLWLFGGFGYPATGGSGYLNDLWKYDPLTNQWTWMSGLNTVNGGGNYGIKGIAASGNLPPSRYLAATWTDNAGNLWLFGGRGPTGDYNDLWKFNITIGLWTWVSGDNTTNNISNYGTLGVTAPTNKPGARNRFNESNGKIDVSGNLWLFGGAGYASTATYGCLNDLWKYNISTNQWTWVSGDNTVNNLSNYGTIGIASATNKPGGRDGGSMWLDTTGNIWVFGGGYDAAGNWNIKLSDLWKYDMSTGFWTWMKGDSNPDQFGVYNTMGVTQSSSKPGGRLMQAMWMDRYGNFWLFGGYGWAASGAVYGLNDLWKYDPLSNNWTWMSGDNTINSTSVYGTIGVSSPTNKPGNRSGDYRWIDNYGNLWKFAGLEWGASNVRNDLWKLLIPQPIAPGNLVSCQTLPAITINASNNNIWVPVYDTLGYIAAEINGNGNSLGNVSTELFTMHAHCREDGNHKMYVNRNLHLTTQNSPASAVSLRLYIRKRELDSLRLNFNSQGQQTGVATINEVDVFKNNDTCRTVGSQTALPLSSTGGSYNTDYYLQVNVNSFSSFYFANKALTFLLPVNIISFTGKAVGNSNHLEWKASCHGPVVFEVQRSDNNFSFIPIGSINASLTDCNSSFYFMDQQPLESENYYRLKAIDADGSIHYSSIVYLGRKKSVTQINLLTAHVANSLELFITSPISGDGILFINDAAGRVVRHETLMVRPGSQTRSINVSSLSAGIYFVYLNTDQGRTNVLRFVK
jgi:N-acetylneuraminic acid mutarotase